MREQVVTMLGSLNAIQLPKTGKDVAFSMTPQVIMIEMYRDQAKDLKA